MDQYREHEKDFTEAHYAELLALARQRYRFISFTETRQTDRTILWRHDIDISPHRARALARIESRSGVRATYFVLLHSDMYNALELEVAGILREIVSLGHDIGLHFDPSFYGAGADVEPLLRMERQVLETTLGVPIDAFSWHNPSVGDWIESLAADRIGGMVNAYAASIRNDFSYVSDSHGIWRFRRLHDVLSDGSERALHVLTHPEWWMEEPMPPRARVSRAISGRADRNERLYDAGLAASGRPNVR